MNSYAASHMGSPQWTIKKMPEINEKNSLRKEIEDIKKNQTEILELKNKTTEMKSSVKGLNSKWALKRTEERINE